MGPVEALHRLLGELFGIDAAALRRFVAFVEQGEAVVRALPGTTVSMDELTLAVTRELRQRGLAPRMFERLGAEFPHKQAEVERVAQLWSAAETAPAPTPAPAARSASLSRWAARAALGKCLQIEPNAVVRCLDERLGGGVGNNEEPLRVRVDRVAGKIDALGEGSGAANTLVDACYLALSDVTEQHPEDRAGAKRVLRAVLGAWLPNRYGCALQVKSMSRSSEYDACDDMQLDTPNQEIGEVAVALADERPASYETRALMGTDGRKRAVVGPRGAVPVPVVTEILTVDEIADQIASAITEQIPSQVHDTQERQRQNTREWLAFFRDPGAERDPKYVVFTPRDRNNLGGDVLDALKAIYPPLRVVELGQRAGKEEGRIRVRLLTIFQDDDD